MSVIELVTAIAAVATAFFTGAAFVFDRIDRAKPRWRFERANSAFAIDSTTAWIAVCAHNVGDGAAFDVSITSTTDDVVPLIGSVPNDAAVLPGEFVDVGVKVRHARGRTALDQFDAPITFEPEAEELGESRVILTWYQPPWRSRQRSLTTRIARLEPSQAVRLRP